MVHPSLQGRRLDRRSRARGTVHEPNQDVLM
jgi:hypothetical protein